MKMGGTEKGEIERSKRRVRGKEERKGRDEEQREGTW